MRSAGTLGPPDGACASCTPTMSALFARMRWMTAALRLGQALTPVSSGPRTLYVITRKARCPVVAAARDSPSSASPGAPSWGPQEHTREANNEDSARGRVRPAWGNFMAAIVQVKREKGLIGGMASSGGAGRGRAVTAIAAPGSD